MVPVCCEMDSRDEGEYLFALGRMHRSFRAICILSLLKEGAEKLGGQMRLGRAEEIQNNIEMGGWLASLLVVPHVRPEVGLLT